MSHGLGGKRRHRGIDDGVVGREVKGLDLDAAGQIREGRQRLVATVHHAGLGFVDAIGLQAGGDLAEQRYLPSFTLKGVGGRPGRVRRVRHRQVRVKCAALDAFGGGLSLRGGGLLPLPFFQAGAAVGRLLVVGRRDAVACKESPDTLLGLEGVEALDVDHRALGGTRRGRRRRVSPAPARAVQRGQGGGERGDVLDAPHLLGGDGLLCHALRGGLRRVARGLALGGFDGGLAGDGGLELRGLGIDATIRRRRPRNAAGEGEREQGGDESTKTGARKGHSR